VIGGLTPEAVLELDDPIGALAQQVQEIVADDRDWMRACILLTCRDLNLPFDTIIGASQAEAQQEGWEHYLPEEDPRYQLYWETLSAVIAQAYCEVIASQKYRWSKKFQEDQAARAEKFRQEQELWHG
jgi:hypothetical protein